MPPKRLAEALSELDELRRKITTANLETHEDGWELFDAKRFTYKLRDIPVESSALLYNLHHNDMFPVGLVDVFIKFFTPALIHQMLAGHALKDPHWNRLSAFDHSKSARVGVPDIYRMFAVKIRLYGLQQRPSEHQRIKDPYLSAVKESVDYFNSKYPRCCQDANRTRKLLSCFLLTHDYFDTLSLNW
ncbi:hypothetical protein B484DRAFT_397470, partial [Ochromonadaceae sp. CCMP2298]